jgi:hypothetical protein
MPHEGPLDLVRQHPEIALEFVQGTAGIQLPGEIAVSLAPTDMSAVIPVQYLADMVVLRLASDAARQILEAMMTTSEYEKTFVERIHDQGISEGKAEGKAESVLKLLDARHLAPSQEQRQRVTSCTDSAQLDLWFDRAVTADTAASVFAD